MGILLRFLSLLVHDPADAMEVLRGQGKKFINGRRLDTFKLLIGHGVAT
jgi:hypothetical protein